MERPAPSHLQPPRSGAQEPPLASWAKTIGAIVHVISTPSTSITTWIVVDAWAASIRAAESASGSSVPSATDVATMMKSEHEIAAASATDAWNAITRTKPATTRMSASASRGRG